MTKDTERRLRYVSGYLQLGMLGDAAHELEAITLVDRAEPLVLGARVELHMETNSWAKVIEVASRLARLAPANERGWICWAYALRELQRIAEAREVLLEAQALHGKTSAVLHYNLACYYCLLGERKTARRFLAHACKMHPEFEKEAREDCDLKGLLDPADAD